MDDIIARLSSRKFLLAVAACAYIIVQVAGGTISTNEGLDSLWKIIVGYMAAEGAADAAGRLKPSMPTDPAPQPEPPAVPATN